MLVFSFNPLLPLVLVVRISIWQLLFGMGSRRQNDE